MVLGNLLDRPLENFFLLPANIFWAPTPPKKKFFFKFLGHQTREEKIWPAPPKKISSISVRFGIGATIRIGCEIQCLLTCMRDFYCLVLPNLVLLSFKLNQTNSITCIAATLQRSVTQLRLW